MRQRGSVYRYIGIGAFFVTLCIIYLFRMYMLSVPPSDSPSGKEDIPTYKRTVPIQAVRGEIYDRNGVPLVVNDYTYDLQIDKGGLPYTDKNINKNLLLILKAAHGAAFVSDQFPLFGQYPDAVFSDGGKDWASYGAYLKKYGLEQTVSAADLMRFMMEKYGLCDNEGALLVEDADVIPLLRLRYELERTRYDTANPYTLAKNIDIALVTRLKEQQIGGVLIKKITHRRYCEPGYASHILGRTGKIQSSSLGYYSDLGYQMDAVVGLDGAEKAFEMYLRGMDGVLTIVEDAQGNVMDEYVSTQPVDGKNIYLTIDIHIQKLAEDSLKRNIELIVENAVQSGQPLSGEDARTGAITVIDPNTGEVIAMASYPTFNLATFTEDFASLNEDEYKPMFSRALQGIYAPGSTFKIGIAAAALQEEIITPETLIYDKGIYTYYNDYQPRCWYYGRYYRGHGNLNVTGAIQHSCNYFFFEVGRLLTIGKMNEYCARYGLGQPTGIELPESVGVLAGPAYSKKVGSYWTAGNTLQAAIGQSDNAFTPLQISCYISMIINGGVRYRAHILSKVEDYLGNILFEYTPSVADVVELKPEYVETVKNGMKSAAEYGSVSTIFANTSYTLGGKTGTAQTAVNGDKSDNALFTVFAPFENPQLVATCVIENGATGSNAGYAIRWVFDEYFRE